MLTGCHEALNILTDLIFAILPAFMLRYVRNQAATSSEVDEKTVSH
jgi:hypothetical protein